MTILSDADREIEIAAELERLKLKYDLPDRFVAAAAPGPPKLTLIIGGQPEPMPESKPE